MPLITCKIYLKLNWIEDCILSRFWDSAKYKTTESKLHVPIVTLSTKNNSNQTKHVNYRFKRFVCWSNYYTVPVKVINDDINMYELLSASFQGVRRLFALAYDPTDDNEAGIKDKKKFFF